MLTNLSHSITFSDLLPIKKLSAEGEGKEEKTRAPDIDGWDISAV